MVNNAGIAKTFAFVDFPLESWQTHLAINVTGVLLCAQHGARSMMRERWGRIINVASVAGMRAVGVGRTGYGTSKAAVIGLTATLDIAQPGDRILMVSFGSGAGSDAFDITVTDKLTERASLATRTQEYIARRTEIDYATYVRFRGKLAMK